MTYIFIGTQSEFHGTRTLSKLGEQIELDPAQAEDWQRNRVAILEKSEVESVMPLADLEKYPTLGHLAAAPQDFRDKLTKLRTIYCEKLYALQAEKDAPAVPPPAAVVTTQPLDAAPEPPAAHAE